MKGQPQSKKKFTYLYDILHNSSEIVERSPLKGVVAVAVGLGERSAVFFDELPKLLEISVGRRAENVGDVHGDPVRDLYRDLLLVGVRHDFDFGRSHFSDATQEVGRTRVSNGGKSGGGLVVIGLGLGFKSHEFCRIRYQLVWKVNWFSSLFVTDERNARCFSLYRELSRCTPNPSSVHLDFSKQ